MLPVNPGGHAAYKTLLLQIFVNIIRIQMLFHGLPGISLNGSGILIFLIPMNFCVQNTVSLVQSQRFLPVCSVLICCLLILKFTP